MCTIKKYLNKNRSNVACVLTTCEQFDCYQQHCFEIAAFHVKSSGFIQTNFRKINICAKLILTIITVIFGLTKCFEMSSFRNMKSAMITLFIDKINIDKTFDANNRDFKAKCSSRAKLVCSGQKLNEFSRKSGRREWSSALRLLIRNGNHTRTHNQNDYAANFRNQIKFHRIKK